MAISLPLPTTPWEEYSTILDGTEYILEFQWNTRYENWSLNIRDIELNLLIAGIKLVPWVSMLGNHPQTNLPLGDLVLVDNKEDVGSALTSIPTLENLSTKFSLLYITSEELT